MDDEGRLEQNDVIELLPGARVRTPLPQRFRSRNYPLSWELDPTTIVIGKRCGPFDTSRFAGKYLVTYAGHSFADNQPVAMGVYGPGSSAWGYMVQAKQIRDGQANGDTVTFYLEGDYQPILAPKHFRLVGKAEIKTILPNGLDYSHESSASVTATDDSED